MSHMMILTNYFCWYLIEHALLIHVTFTVGLASMRVHLATYEYHYFREAVLQGVRTPTKNHKIATTGRVCLLAQKVWRLLTLVAPTIQSNGFCLVWILVQMPSIQIMLCPVPSNVSWMATSWLEVVKALTNISPENICFLALHQGRIASMLQTLLSCLLMQLERKRSQMKTYHQRNQVQL